VIVHVLRFSFKPEATAENIYDSLESLRRMAEMKTVSFSIVGDYLGKPDDGFSHSVAFGIADLETFERYMYEPVHRQADSIIHPHVSQFDVFDISDDHDPDLEAKIAAIHQRRFNSDPALAELIDAIPESNISPANERH
jgi:hypothetical protein